MGTVKVSALSNDTGPTLDDLVMTVDAGTSSKRTTLQKLLDLFSANKPADDGWQSGLLPDVSSVTNNGNGSINIVFASTVESLLYQGYKLRTTRAVAAPMQCADIESSSSQYFAKASATGFVTGATWTFKAKIKPESYATGVIVALDDGTNRVHMYLNASGQIVVGGGLAAGDDTVTSYQSVELGKWQEVTGSITIGTPTGEIRINDRIVPSVVGTSASTTMTINGDETLYIGRNAGGSYFDGKIAQVAVFNAIISDATLKTYSQQTMAGSETNCKGFWSLSNTLTDSSASANNLTAFGGALATDTDSPFSQDGVGVTDGVTDLSVVTKVSTTTATVQVPEGCTVDTSLSGIDEVAFSNAKSPFGWISDRTRWQVVCHIRANIFQASVTAATVYNPGGFYVSVPVGTWMESHLIFGGFTGSTDIAKDFYIGLSASNTAFTGGQEDGTKGYDYRVTDTFRSSYIKADVRFTIPTATNYYLLFQAGGAGTLTNGGVSTSTPTTIAFTPVGI